MAKFLRQETRRVRFSDGRRGTQTVHVYDDGTRELAEVVVTRGPDGRGRRDVYARRSDVQAYVYSLADLGNVTWEIEG